ncbi:Hypothetical predicted protein [Octopus vulgaris]|uniref:Uncharacterized protein n=1 Tax=Octopus vulgaris TaxID=6645 RepID=A0AA36FJ56_OCTVU|nr:Hypothetical predicted protein [Octopus vulgaris]
MQQESEEIVDQTGLTLERLAKLCNLAKELKEGSKKWDDDMVHSVQFCNKVDEVMNPYKMLFERKKKQRHQLLITMFLQPGKKEPVPTATTTTTVVPSAEVEEEKNARGEACQNSRVLDAPGRR